MRTISIVIATYDRRDSLARLLAQVRSQLEAEPDLAEGTDVVVVVDGSTDGSLELCESIDVPVAVKAVWQRNRGRAAARNVGLRLATGELVLFLDDDVLPEPGLLRRHRDAHEAGPPRLVMGPHLTDLDPGAIAPNQPWVERIYEEMAASGVVDRADRFSTANTSGPTEVFRDVGGFDEGFTGWGGEDTELGQRVLRAGYEILFDPAARATHSQSLTLSEFCANNVSAGRTLPRIIGLHPELVDVLLPVDGDGDRRGLRAFAARAHRTYPLRSPTAYRLIASAACAVARLERALTRNRSQRAAYVAMVASTLAGLAETDRTGTLLARKFGVVEPSGELRIVHAVRSDAFAGVERYIADIAREFATRGHNVTVIGGEHRTMLNAIGDSAVALERGETMGRVGRALVRRGRRADVLHLHMTAAEAAAVMMWPVVHTPSIATRHFAAPRGSSVAGRLAAPLIRRRITREISISRYVATSTGEPSAVLLNAVADAPAVDPVAPVVLMVQRLEPEKRTIDGLAAWSSSSLPDEGWELWIAGEGSQRGTLEREVASMKLRGVRFFGQRHDVDDLRRRAGLYLATAPTEPFGLAVAEAMAAGLPVVAAAGGGHLETIGAAAPELLFPPGDVDACGCLLRDLAHDLARRRRLGAEVRAFQQAALSLDAHVDRLVEIYRGCSKRGASIAGSPTHGA
jgi:glycosyltransferase involved in cell wall biosynthesis/GT2 family glycosyltransferase